MSDDSPAVVQLGTWTRIDAATGVVTTGDDWTLAKAIKKALAYAPIYSYASERM
jgi:hypothetical protein